MSDSPYNPDADPQPSDETVATWHDAARSRDVPIRAYVPRGLTHPAPLVLFSHGTGSSRDGYAYLGRHWAGRGYVVIHPTHEGSDARALCGGEHRPARRLADVVADVAHRRDRPLDVSFVLDQALRDSALASTIDPQHIAAAGHSFGAFTALALVGLQSEFPGPAQGGLRDSRVRAAIALSPQSEGRLGLHAQSWDALDCPILTMAGSADYELGTRSAAGRRRCFERSAAPEQYHVLLDGATHAAFADAPHLRILTRLPDPAHHAAILAITTAFLDAQLRHDPQAHAWLSGGGAQQVLPGSSRIEWKNLRSG